MYKQVTQSLPQVDRIVIILSGGMDSTIAMRIAVERYGAENVSALTFNYGQKQKHEIEKAKASTAYLGVKHRVIDASFLYDISLGFSANVDTEIAMPTIEDIQGDPRPKTYVPNRNMILLSIAAAYAETVGAGAIFCGIQLGDEYSYHDCTRQWLGKINDLLSENRVSKIQVHAPFSVLSKQEELAILQEIGDLNILNHTLSCYNPNEKHKSCGKCPTCHERIKAFKSNGMKDPVPYSTAIAW